MEKVSGGKLAHVYGSPDWGKLRVTEMLEAAWATIVEDIADESTEVKRARRLVLEVIVKPEGSRTDLDITVKAKTNVPALAAAHSFGKLSLDRTGQIVFVPVEPDGQLEIDMGGKA